MIEAGRLRTVSIYYARHEKPYHAMCMKVRVTESTFQESCQQLEQNSGSVIQEPSDGSEIKDEDMEKILRTIVASERVDRESISQELNMKLDDVNTTLEKLGMQRMYR